LYVLFRREAGGVTWPLVATLQRDAVTVFTSLRKAERFRLGRGLDAAWGVGAMRPAEFLRWLADNGKAGVRHLLVNPPARGSLCRGASIFEMLVENEG
jgi:hypothetical protein